SALSAVLDDAYLSQHPDMKAADGDAVLVEANTALPSHAITAVKRSLDFWQRAVEWTCSQEWEPHLVVVGTERMRMKLIEQADIWQTLITGQQNLGASTAETVTQKILHDVTEKIVEMVREDLPQAFENVREVTRQIADQIKQQTTAALDQVRDTASAGWNA